MGIIGHSTSYHSIYIYALCSAIVDVGIYTRFVCLIGVLGPYLNGISRLISPGNREPRHCSLLSCLGSRLPGSWLYWETRAKSKTSLILPKKSETITPIQPHGTPFGRRQKGKELGHRGTRQIRRSPSSTSGGWAGVSTAEGKRTERFSENSSRNRDSLKSEVRLPRE